MKTTMSKQILFFTALGCMAAPVAAQTVDVTLQCGQSYTINSTVAATAGATYRWLENGSTVTGAAANYTMPATKSVGIYTYIRQAMSAGCTDWQSSNAFTVKVENKEGGICIGGITWAKSNVDVPGSFTASPGTLGMMYKWDSLRYMPATGPVLPWDKSDSPNKVWSSDQNPCPAGWSIPTAAMLSMIGISSPVCDPMPSSGHWVDASPDNWNIAGRWYGPDACIATQHNDVNAVFFPVNIQTAGYEDEVRCFTCYASGERVPFEEYAHLKMIMDVTHDGGRLARWSYHWLSAWYVRCVR
jgi:hypothetical protein